jgi:hypothetical protein
MTAKEFKGFKSAFAALSTMRRSETIEMRIGNQMLANAVADRAEKMGFLTCDIGVSHLMLAAIAANDILFLDLTLAPDGFGFGLKIGDGAGRRSTGQGWRDLLAGKYIQPVPQPKMPQEVRSQARVRSVGPDLMEADKMALADGQKPHWW